MILEKAPTINRQFDNFKHSLKLNPNRSSSHFVNINTSVSNTVTVNETHITRNNPPSVPPSSPSATAIESNDNYRDHSLDSYIMNNDLTFNNLLSPGISNRINRLISNSRSSANNISHVDTPVRETLRNE